jgi:DNA-directed RNA polymerase subunit RPC12/RpoP
MSLRGAKCPNCGTKLDDPRIIRYDSSFRCTNCATELRIPRYYVVIGAWASLAITIALCFGMGLHNGTFILGMLIFFFPTMFSISILQRHLFPPRLELGTDAVSILPKGRSPSSDEKAGGE